MFNNVVDLGIRALCLAQPVAEERLLLFTSAKQQMLADELFCQTTFVYQLAIVKAT